MNADTDPEMTTRGKSEAGGLSSSLLYLFFSLTHYLQAELQRIQLVFYCRTRGSNSLYLQSFEGIVKCILLGSELCCHYDMALK